MGLQLKAITRDTARRFIAEHHRHNIPPSQVRFCVGVVDEHGILAGVATASQPVARLLDDGESIEVNRSCTNGTPNANSMLYGAITRAAKALGFTKAITYTLVTESGVSLKAAGWTIDKDDIPPRTWNMPNRHRYDRDLFGSRLPPPVNRRRWVRKL